MLATTTVWLLHWNGHADKAGTLSAPTYVLQKAVEHLALFATGTVWLLHWNELTAGPGFIVETILHMLSLSNLMVSLSTIWYVVSGVSMLDQAVTRPTSA